jgi:hypothetical protein
MSTMADRLWDVTRTLPEPLLAEVLDFAEFLQTRHAHAPQSVKEISLAKLSGGLEKSTAFAASPLELQRQLRDEWH